MRRSPHLSHLTNISNSWAFLDFVDITEATAALTNPRNHRMNGRDLKLEYASPDAVRRGGHLNGKNGESLRKKAKNITKSATSQWDQTENMERNNNQQQSTTHTQQQQSHTPVGSHLSDRQSYQVGAGQSRQFQSAAGQRQRGTTHQVQSTSSSHPSQLSSSTSSIKPPSTSELDSASRP